MSRASGADASVSVLGMRVLRTEDPRFLTTAGVYTEDVLTLFTGPDLAALPPHEEPTLASIFGVRDVVA